MTFPPIPCHTSIQYKPEKQSSPWINSATQVSCIILGKRRKSLKSNFFDGISFGKIRLMSGSFFCQDFIRSFSYNFPPCSKRYIAYGNLSCRNQLFGNIRPTIKLTAPDAARYSTHPQNPIFPLLICDKSRDRRYAEAFPSVVSFAYYFSLK